MAGEEFIKVAAGQLQRAMVAKQNDANQIRRQISDLDRNRRKKKQELETPINQNNASAARADTNDTHRVNVIRHNLGLEAEKSRLDNDYDHQRAQLEQKLRDNEGSWRDLKGKIAELGY